MCFFCFSKSLSSLFFFGRVALRGRATFLSQNKFLFPALEQKRTSFSHSHVNFAFESNKKNTSLARKFRRVEDRKFARVGAECALFFV
jgi:hypothetical protein